MDDTEGVHSNVQLRDHLCKGLRRLFLDSDASPPCILQTVQIEVDMPLAQHGSEVTQQCWSRVSEQQYLSTLKGHRLHPKRLAIILGLYLYIHSPGLQGYPSLA